MIPLVNFFVIYMSGEWRLLARCSETVVSNYDLFRLQTDEQRLAYVSIALRIIEFGNWPLRIISALF
jgi:hypothetical protein